MKPHVRIHPEINGDGFWYVVLYNGRGQWRSMAVRPGKAAATELKRKWERRIKKEGKA